MKIVIAYPSLESKKGIPQLSQNRQFQWTASGPLAYFIYPVIPAYAATMLKKAGHEVVWLDGLAEKWPYQQWLTEVKKIKPDLLIIETKTPVVKRHWKIINELKQSTINNQQLTIVLVGDHVTALPKESFKKSKVDYVLTGGDYDFLLLNLVNHLTCDVKLEPGIWYREKLKNKKTEKLRNTGRFKLNHDLNKLPLIDRDLTKWPLYAYKNSNFFCAPGTYTMFARDCWWGRCTFCSWTTLYPASCYRTVKPARALDEVGQLIKRCQVKEIMDDSGTFPTGEWLRKFCQGMIKRGYHRKVRINCNMRFNSGLTKKDYQLMGKAGFRFLLFGLESANQETLDRLNKDLKIDQVEPVLSWSKKAGLWPHLTVMVGYPWEGEKEINKTTKFIKSLFKKGLVNSMQATLVIPYPGTPLFEHCQKRGLLRTKDWNRYDMAEPVIKTKTSPKKLMATIREFYHASIWNKTFIINTLKQFKDWDGIKYVSFQALKYFGKLWEFK